MSVSSINQSNQLGVDVLQMIFQQLDGEDLVNCEAVCRQWHDILLTGTPWRRLFHRKIHYSPSWRKEQKKLEKKEQTLQTEQYRDVCRKILQVNRNWRTGNLTKATYPVDSTDICAARVTISDDYVAWRFSRHEDGRYRKWCAFLDSTSTEMTIIPLVSWCGDFNGMLVSWPNPENGSFSVEIRAPQNNWHVNVRNQENFDVRQIFFGSDLFVCYSAYAGNQDRIRIWRVGNPSTLLHDRTFEDRNMRILKVDEQFIVGETENLELFALTLHFISIETLEEIRSLSVKSHRCPYDRGLSFQYRGNGIIRMMDVASGIFFNNMLLPFRKEDKKFVEWTCASTNSNRMVIGWKYSKKIAGILSHLSVYDLEAVKQPNSDPGSHLLYTLQFQFVIENFVMDETRIAFSGKDGKNKRSVTVLNFANFGSVERKPSDLEENPEDNEGVKMKIIYDSSFDPWSYMLN